MANGKSKLLPSRSLHLQASYTIEAALLLPLSCQQTGDLLPLQHTLCQFPIRIQRPLRLNHNHIAILQISLILYLQIIPPFPV